MTQPMLSDADRAEIERIVLATPLGDNFTLAIALHFKRVGLELAAKVCDQWMRGCEQYSDKGYAARQIGSAIRALASPAPTCCHCDHEPSAQEERTRVCGRCGKPIIV